MNKIEVFTCKLVFQPQVKCIGGTLRRNLDCTIILYYKSRMDDCATLHIASEVSNAVNPPVAPGPR